MFVEAGAGTGKTTALVERVIGLIGSGHFELAELAAITFTEAAATELRARLHERIAELAADEHPAWGVLGRAWPAGRRAALTTIHGFAMRVLTDHSLAAGLPLRFAVLDELQSALRREQSCSDFLDDFFDVTPPSPIVLATVAIGVTPWHLRTSVA